MSLGIIRELRGVSRILWHQTPYDPDCNLEDLRVDSFDDLNSVNSRIGRTKIYMALFMTVVPAFLGYLLATTGDFSEGNNTQTREPTEIEKVFEGYQNS